MRSWERRSGCVPLNKEEEREIKIKPCEDSVRKQPLHARKLALTRRRISRHPDLGLPASRTVRNKCLLFMPPSLWYFVTATWTKTPPSQHCLRVCVFNLQTVKFALFQVHLWVLTNTYYCGTAAIITIRKGSTSPQNSSTLCLCSQLLSHPCPLATPGVCRSSSFSRDVM